MSDNKSLGLPLFLCMGVLAFLLTVGAQLYLQGAPEPTTLTATASPSIDTQAPGEWSRPTNMGRMSTSEKALSEEELSTASSAPFIAAGNLLSSTGEAIEGADVRLYLVQGDQERELTRVLSNAEGHFESELKALAHLSAESLLAANIEARVIAPGHMPLRQRLQSSASEGGTTPELRLVAGHYLRGRILNDAGHPVARCSVDLYLNCPPGTPRSETKHTQRTNRHGEYTFGWKRGHGLRFVDAEHSKWGDATIALSSLATDEDQELEDIQLDPGGELEGSVTCKFGGDLLPGVRIDAHPASTNRTGKRKWTQTGTDGNFHLSGLVPGEYTLWVEDASAAVGTWKTGSRQIELEVDLVRLVVSVRDPLHNPLPGQRIQFVNIAGNTAASMIETASDTSKGRDAVVVFSPARLSGSKETKNASRAAVAMRATGVTLPTYEELIEIPNDACRIDHTFTLLSAEELGWLEVNLTDEDGKQLQNPVITLTSLLSGEQVTNLLDHSEDPDVWLSSLPPGMYDLQVSPRNPHNAQNMVLGMDSNDPIQIRMGRETKVDLQAVRGGRVRLLIETQESSALAPSSYPVRMAHAVIQSADSGVSIDEAPAFEVELQGQPNSEFPVRKSLLSFEVIEPGDYRLRVFCDGFQPKTVSFTVEAGEISKQRVELRAQ